MSRLDRRLARLRQAPSGVRPEELRTVLEAAGFVLKSTRGSHWVYHHPNGTRPIVIPYRRPLLPVYVRQALDAIDEVLEP
jgi:predicted RNA binding protein YcfA (HicA-like mRNA interferase family)